MGGFNCILRCHYNQRAMTQSHLMNICSTASLSTSHRGQQTSKLDYYGSSFSSQQGYLKEIIIKTRTYLLFLM